MQSGHFEHVVRRVSRTLGSRRALLATLLSAAAVTNAVETSRATIHKKRKHRKVTLCYNGQTVKKVGVQAKKLVKRGATPGACASGCPTECCADTDCSSSQICNEGTCVTPHCGLGLPCTVFVTSSGPPSNAIGLSGMDDYCQGLAQAAGLTGTYMAWLSGGSETPATRFSNTGSAGPYVLVANGSDAGNPPPTVASSFAALTSCSGGGNCLEHAIDRDETGAGAGGGNVWTATSANGSALSSCSNWSTNDSQASAGYSDWSLTDAGWTQVGDFPCDLGLFLYCFEQAV